MKIRAWLPVCRAVVAVAAVSVLAACTTTDKDDPASASFEKRLVKPDMTKRSQFDKKFDTAALGDRGAMKVMGKKSYATSDYKGNTEYKGLKAFQTKAFAGAGKTSREQTQVSPLGKQNSTFSGKVFKTGDSEYSNKKAPGANMVFKDATQVYQTGDYAPGKKSLEDNKRPYFKPAGELDKEKTAYTEQDVKALLNRN